MDNATTNIEDLITIIRYEMNCVAEYDWVPALLTAFVEGQLTRPAARKVDGQPYIVYSNNGEKAAVCAGGGSVEHDGHGWIFDSWQGSEYAKSAADAFRENKMTPTTARPDVTAPATRAEALLFIVEALARVFAIRPGTVAHEIHYTLTGAQSPAALVARLEDLEGCGADWAHLDYTRGRMLPLKTPGISFTEI